MSRKIHAVIIDPQNSFCKIVDAAQQQIIHDGELCVPGAWQDMERAADMINAVGHKIDKISCTLDSHQENHIGNVTWFKDKNGNHPAPFTIMRAENNKIIGTVYGPNGPQDVGEYTTVKPSTFKWTYSYLETLANGGRYPHCCWPPHCLIGTTGYNVVAPLMESFINWCRHKFQTINFVTKGSNPYVEHFSGVRAEVVDPNDPSTQLNSAFIQDVMEADEIPLFGEAGSHCLPNTIGDMANSFNDDSFISKCVLITDATSPVPGFEHLQKKFIDDMTKRGMKLSTTVDYLR